MKPAARPLKLVHLLQGLEIGGLEIMAMHLLEGLDPARFQTQVIGYDTLGPLALRLELGGIPCQLLKRRPGVDLRYIVQLARVLVTIRPDILHLHNPTAFFYGALAGRLASVTHIVYTEHGRDFASSKRNKFIHRMLARLVDRVVVVAESSRRVLETEGVPPKRITTIHNGIDAAHFLVDEDRWGQRAKLGFTREQPLLGIVARLDPIKNHAALLRAMPLILQAFPDANLLVIGEGPLRTELERLSDELGVREHVHFLGVRDDVPELLSILDVAVLCSLSEGLSLTLLEECAAGKPVVATRVGGNPEIVADGQTGLLVPVGDDAALAQAINRLLADPEYAQSMGQAARQRFMAEFTLERMVACYVELYEARAPACAATTVGAKLGATRQPA
jgi:sugar transferase (PEP-CTERM/EpsH1 system associated)